MGFGGHVLSMINSLKNNVRPKRKPLSRLKKSRDFSKHSESLHFKEVSAKDLESIKLDIKKKAKESKSKEWFVLIVFLISVIFLVYISFNPRVKQHFQKSRISYSKPQYQKDIEKERKEFHIRYSKLINKGSLYIEEKDYENAKLILYKAYLLWPSKYEALYLYTKALVLDCTENDVKCNSAKQSLENLEYSFPNHSETELLRQLYQDNKE